MDFTERNEIFMDNEGMIRRVMRRNWALICAMRLDWDDVYQELAMAALSAIETFDPTRSECIQAHIWMKLQYAVLDIKRQYRPCGLTCFSKQQRPRTKDWSGSWPLSLRRRSFPRRCSRPCPA